MATELERYIRQAAAARGIDPDTAVRVAKSEGGLSDPVRRAEYVKGGYREPSYGPFQLLIGGPGTGFPEGMGNDALAAGIDPRDPANAYKSIDFALDQAKSGGWTPWYGAAAAGIPRWGGINGQASGAPPNPMNPQERLGGDSLVPRDQSPQIAGQTSTPLFSPTSSDGGGGFFASPTSPLPPAVAAYATDDDKKKKNLLGRLGDALSAVPNAPMPSGGLLGDARSTGDALNKALSNPTIADFLLKRRLG